ncbi:MAG: hypothetical protein GF309_06875 [Candidatus Lokiarchaeota archaeon]|nr:hypothetical protein [Candidatus Lokiarchaeota archaeon]
MDMLGATIGDYDYDGLDDRDEIELGTDIHNVDTDCDNLNDAFEVKIVTEPLDPSDYPGAQTATTTTSTTSPLPDELRSIMLALVIGDVGIRAVVVVIFVLTRRRMSS